MYSDMSMRIIDSASSNMNSASERATSVLPTPVGPRKMNEPIGRLGFLSPARERRIARVTRPIAWSCPITRLCSWSSIPSSLAVSACASLRDRDLRPRSDDVGDVVLGDLERLVLRGALVGPLLLEPLLLEAQLLLTVADRGGLLELLRFDDRLFLELDLADLVLDLADLGRRQRRLQPHARGGLVDQVDRLVGQEAIGDVAVAELGRGDQRLVGDRDLVVRLVAVAQALEDLDRLLDRRLPDHDRLEAALERRVLLDVLAELVERRRADALQLAARERGLDDVRGVDGALGGAGADQGVQLVDEQDDLAGRAADLVHHALHALFELAAVLGPGDQPGQVERDDALVAQRLGDLALDDALRQALGDRRLADAGFADQRRVVLGAPAEDLDDPLDLVGPADDRVELVLASQRREVAAVRVEGGGLRLALGRGRLPLGAEQRRRLDPDLGGIDAEVRQDAGGDAFAFADQPEQQVLGPDVVVVELAGLFEGQLDDALGARREDHLLLDGLAAPADDRLDLLAHLGQVDPKRLEDFGRQALTLGDDPEQDVLGPDVVVPEPLRLFLSEHDAAPRAFGERFPH